VVSGQERPVEGTGVSEGPWTDFGYHAPNKTIRAKAVQRRTNRAVVRDGL